MSHRGKSETAKNSIPGQTPILSFCSGPLSDILDMLKIWMSNVTIFSSAVTIFVSEATIFCNFLLKPKTKTAEKISFKKIAVTISQQKGRQLRQTNIGFLP